MQAIGGLTFRRRQMLQRGEVATHHGQDLDVCCPRSAQLMVTFELPGLDSIRDPTVSCWIGITAGRPT